MDGHVGSGQSRSVTPTQQPSAKFAEFGGGAPRGRRGPGLDRRATFWFIYLPPLLWLGTFFVLPVLLMAAFSFRPDMRGDLLQLWTPTFDQYASVAGHPHAKPFGR